MVHYSCDLCGKEMRASDSDRFVVQIEIRAANNTWALTEDDVEDDNLEKVSQLLQDGDTELDDLCGPVKARYDLCPECRDRFLKNPFNCQMAKLNFSEN